MSTQEIEILEDTPKYYLVNIESRETKMYKINKEDLEKSHNKEIEKAAKALDWRDVEQGRNYLKELIDKPITVDEYEEAALAISTNIQEFSNQIKGRNIFHYYIKNIDPVCYGKAGTFTKEIKSLYKVLSEIKNWSIGMEMEGKK